MAEEVTLNAKYMVELSVEERNRLEQLVMNLPPSARRHRRAKILLLADEGVTHEDIADETTCGTSTVFRIKRRFIEGGLEHALHEKRRFGAERKLSAQHEAMLVALACSDAPDGRAQWTLQLLADQLVLLTDVESVSRETIRRRLKENQLKPWQKDMWCIPKVDTQFVARMEDILDLYAEPHDEMRPVVCFDETPVQLVSETREPIPAKPGRRRRYDYEYRREGTANLFMFIDSNRSWRHVKVTEHRSNVDFANAMRDLVQMYPDAECIRVVLDNLSTHHPGALYEAFEPAEARSILRRIRFHYTPKHGSWLNMAEIEIAALNKQCLKRRIATIPALKRQTTLWARQRNAARATIRWMFDVDAARTKMGRSYPVKTPATVN